MATSGSTDFSQTRNEIIEDAYDLIGAFSKGDTIPTNDITRASNALNRMVKAWETKGINLWTEKEGAVFLTNDQQSYSLSSSSATDISGDDPVFTTLTSDCSSTSVSVDSSSRMNVSDKIGIVLDDDTIFWSTIASVDSSTTITMVAGPSSTGSSGNNVFVFTTRLDRPLHITSARIRYSNGAERPLKKCGRAEFMSLPDKAATGPANRIYYSPQVSDSILYVWPTSSDPGDCIRISYVRRIQDFDASSNTPDLPQECYEAIVTNLALRLAPACGIDINKLDPDLKELAQTSLIDLQLWDGENGSTRIIPSPRYGD